MRKKIIAGNWKMNKTVKEAVLLVKDLKKLVKDVKDKEIVVCPPFTSLQSVSMEIKKSNIKLGAQNIYHEKQGAFTGEISPSMLKDIGVEYVIIGHSERRHILNESNELINKKILSALENNLKPIFCVGETLEERESNKTEDVVKKQMKEGLKNVRNEQMNNIVIAYEPIWAIGTGKNAAPEQAEAAHIFIRNMLKVMFNEKIAKETRILYGGSVNPNNIKGLIKEDNIDGALVGGASLDAKSFSELVKW